MTEEPEEDKFKATIKRLTEPLEKWESIKKILLDDIRSTQDVIAAIDRIIDEEHKKYSAKN